MSICEGECCDEESGALTQLTDGGNNLTPGWSPVDHEILFWNYSDGDAELFVMDAIDGDPVDQLTTNSDADQNPDWGVIREP